MAKAVYPYGDGHACKRIADKLEDKEYIERINQLHPLLLLLIPKD